MFTSGQEHSYSERFECYHLVTGIGSREYKQKTEITVCKGGLVREHLLQTVPPNEISSRTAVLNQRLRHASFVDRRDHDKNQLTNP